MIMTTRQKAAAYDMAIERTRRMIEDYKNRGLDNYYACAKESLEKIFPELAESEDERIRKEIMELVMQPTWKTEKEFHRRNELCTWLEKHKYTEDDLDKAYKCADEVQYRRGYEDAKKEIEKKGEQKPAWSKEDEEILNQVIEDIVKLAGPYVCYHKDVDWLKSLKYRVQPQNRWKPSILEINMFEDVIDGKENPCNYHATLHAMLEQLKKLREE